MGIALSVCTATSCSQAPVDRESLVLSEVSARPLSLDFDFVGIATTDDHGLVVWGREPNVVLRFTKTLAPNGEWALVDAIRPLSVWSSGSRTEVVALDPPAVHTLGEAGTVIESQPIAVEGTLLEAVRGRAGWYTLTESHGSGELTVSFPDSNGVIPAPAYGGLTLGEGELGTTVWLTQLRYPFVVYALSVSEGTAIAMQPDPAQLDSLLSTHGGERRSNWASLPVVPIDGGFLQTLTDLAGDRRIFVVYGPAGQTLSANLVDVPLSLLVGSETLPRVYGARRTDILELVEYSYRWNDR